MEYERNAFARYALGLFHEAGIKDIDQWLVRLRGLR